MKFQTYLLRWIISSKFFSRFILLSYSKQCLIRFYSNNRNWYSKDYRYIFAGFLNCFFVLLPVVLYIFLDLIKYKLTGRTQNGKMGFVWHLPILKLARHWQYLEELSAIIREENLLKCLKKKILSNFSDVEIPEGSPEILKEVVKYSRKGNQDAKSANEAALLLQKCKMDLKQRNSDFESKVASTKMVEIFCESGPQFIIQLAQVLRNIDVRKYNYTIRLDHQACHISCTVVPHSCISF